MTVTSGQNVKMAVEDRVAVLTIDHRPVNALDRQTLQELGQLVDALRAEAAVKVVIVTGGGSLAFVAGADIKEVSQLGSVEAAKEMAALGQSVFLKLQRLGKPVIAAINEHKHSPKGKKGIPI
mgnify:CR=1 FL=1